MPTIINILELDLVSSVKLFMERTGECNFKPEEVLALVLENPKNCLRLLLPEISPSLDVAVEEISSKQKD